VSTLVAVETEEPMREHAAAEKGAKLLLDETWRWMFPERRTGEEAFQLLAHYLVEERLLRLVALVFGHRVPSRDRRGVAPLERLGARRGCGKSGCGVRVTPAAGPRELDTAPPTRTSSENAS